MAKWLLLLSMLIARPVFAGDGLDVKDWLSRPGVKLLAVEFYASWCGPCKKAVPQWKALHEKYRDQGLRLVVVSVQDPDGACVNPGWNPDDVVCDAEGRLAEAWGVGDRLPAAFLWTWRGPLLVRKGHVEEVASAVEEELARLPRVTLDDGMDGSVHDLLRTELARTGKVDVVAGAEEEEALAEIRRKSHELQFSDRSACKLGQRLAANSLLKASFVKAGSGKRLLVQIFSAESGCLNASAGVFWNVEKPGMSAAEVVVELVNNLRVAVELPGTKQGRPVVRTDHSVGGEVTTGVVMDEGEKVVNQNNDSTGFLVIETDPPGAVVKVNGKEAGHSPKQLELTTGHYVVAAENGRLWHVAQQELDLTILGARVMLKLQKAFGALRIETKPSDADVWVNGEKVAKGTYYSREKPSGRYSIRVDREHYLTHSEEVVVEDDQETRRVVTLEENFGSLRVTSEPSGCAVALNGEETGKFTPCDFAMLEPGVYTLTLTHAGYGDAVRRSTVERGRRSDVEATLQAKLGVLSIMSSYEGGQMCRGDVYVDGIRRGETPWKGELVALEHDIRIVCENGERKESVRVLHNQRVSLEWKIATPGSELRADESGEKVSLDTRQLEDCKDRSREAFQKGMKHKTIGRTAEMKGEFRKALDGLIFIYQLRPHNGKNLYMLATCYKELGARKKAYLFYWQLLDVCRGSCDWQIPNAFLRSIKNDMETIEEGLDESKEVLRTIDGSVIGECIHSCVLDFSREADDKEQTPGRIEYPAVWWFKAGVTSAHFICKGAPTLLGLEGKTEDLCPFDSKQ